MNQTENIEREALSEAMARCDSASIAQLLEEIRAAWYEEVRLLHADAVRITKELPKPRGIFVGDAERIPTYRLICRLLILVEERKRRIHEFDFRLLRLEDRFFALRGEELRAELMLESATEALATPFGDQFFAQVEKNATLHASYTAFLEKTEGVVTRLLPAFCNRAMSAADIEHDGAACDPFAVSRLLGELCAALAAVEYTE